MNKMKELEKTDKYSDLDRELKKLGNMEMAAIPIVVGALKKVPKYQEKRVR